MQPTPNEVIAKKPAKTPMVKTPLEYYWTFWYVYKNPNKNKTNNYNSVLKKIFTIDCIEDFWKYTHHQRLQ